MDLEVEVEVGLGLLQLRRLLRLNLRQLLLQRRVVLELQLGAVVLSSQVRVFRLCHRNQTANGRRSKQAVRDEFGRPPFDMICGPQRTSIHDMSKAEPHILRMECCRALEMGRRVCHLSGVHAPVRPSPRYTRCAPPPPPPPEPPACAAPSRRARVAARHDSTRINRSERPASVRRVWRPPSAGCGPQQTRPQHTSRAEPQRPRTE